ncbi:fumarate reductase subunit C [Phytoactinopolyspora mesophila]|uniref:Fumarate reductase subunit C n=1 Tax=Phytoactinopolyspora mesophila TaxID=2650750 RepID=A0A7K3M6Y1_9ACTN|nr:fumarate reductase subunit C [Phytoactinopolyspora mesophila]NDL59036.1 fumarate reductase subunit C [Phytoactinopolyspora mesophila]
MTGVPARPRGYRQQPSLWWWMHKRSYTLFILRELSSVFVAWFVLFLLLLVYAVAGGAERYQSFLDSAANPVVIGLNAVALAFVCLHVVTWFNLTPQAMPVRVRGRRVPSAVIVGSEYLALAIVSAFVAWLVVG